MAVIAVRWIGSKLKVRNPSIRSVTASGISLYTSRATKLEYVGSLLYSSGLSTQ